MYYIMKSMNENTQMAECYTKWVLSQNSTVLKVLVSELLSGILGRLGQSKEVSEARWGQEK